MAYSGNKGEWSELYTFFKLLADGKLYSGDGQLNRYDEKWFPILEIFRDDSPKRNSYKINAGKNNILIAGEHIELEIPQEIFNQEAIKLLNFIKGLRSTTGINLETERFMKEIDCGRISAKSSDKADIRIVIHNLKNGTKPELGYSIKSKLGSDSTLINAVGDNTNFIFKISGISKTEALSINSQGKFRNKFELLDNLEAKVIFHSVAGQGLHNNLTMLDLGMERIVAECLLLYYRGSVKTIESAVNIINEKDPIGIMANTSQPMYEYKMKQFLLAFALGMTASKAWQGKFNANGGFIVVKDDGDIVCYHFFDRNDFSPSIGFDAKFYYSHKLFNDISFLDRIGINTHLYAFTYIYSPGNNYFYGEQIGIYLRGILDNSFFGNLKPLYTTSQAIIFSLDIPYHLFTTNFKKFDIINFNLQMSPFVDIALTHNRVTGTMFNAKEGYYCAGLEFLVYPLKWSSYTIRASIGFDIRNVLNSESFIDGLLKYNEIFIGIGHQY